MNATQAQAAMLTAVASHLTDHPDLAAVNILSDDRLQLRHTTTPGRDLTAWADTLTDPRVDVQLIHCDYTDTVQAFVYVVGYLDSADADMSVWDVVPGLVDALGGPEAADSTGHLVITLDGLRDFANDGTAPRPAGELAPA